jgi:hypothetical protein
VGQHRSYLSQWEKGLEQSLDQFFRFAFGAIAILLLIAGAYLALSDRWRPSLAVLTCGFLIVLVVFISRFKIVEGPWGFRAETWDQKQVEAAQLVDKLTVISDGIAEQVSLVVSRLGLWDSSYSLPQMEVLIDQLKRLLESANISQSRRDEILMPAYKRVEADYLQHAKRLVERALEQRRREVVETPPNMADSDWPALREKRQQQDADVRRLRGSAPTDPKITSIEALLAFVRAAPSLETRSNSLQADIGELKLDLDYFRSNHKLRRRQDFSYLYQDF